VKCKVKRQIEKYGQIKFKKGVIVSNVAVEA
jgi:hypothetical protein